jgi:hypothetical protein
MRLRSILLGVLIACASIAAHGQAVLQSGPWQPGHVPVYVGQGSSQAILQDSGPASGGSVGVGLSELGLTVRGTGSPPFANRGTGPLFSNLCDYDAPTNSAGFHYLCFSPNAQGGGLIAYGAAGNAPQLPLNLVLNGTTYPFPFTGQTGVTGGWLNTRLAKIGAYLVSNADKGSTIALSGAGPYTLTFGPASGYDANFLALALNESGAPKTVTLSGGATFTLIAGQSAMVFNQNNVWQYHPPGRFSLTGNVTFYLNADTNVGNDTSDGLTPGTAWRTLAHAHATIANKYDTANNVVTLQLADGTYAPLSTNLGFTGQGGYSEYIITGNCSSPTSVIIQGGAGPALSFGATSGGRIQATINCMYLQSSGGNGIEVWGAGTTVTTGNIYFATAGCNWQAAHGAELALQSGQPAFSVQQNAACLINVQTAGRFVADSPNIIFLNAPHYSLATAYSVDGGQIIAGGATFTGGQFVSGQRFAVQNNALIATGGAGLNYFPGTIAGIVADVGSTYN